MEGRERQISNTHQTSSIHLLLPLYTPHRLTCQKHFSAAAAVTLLHFYRSCDAVYICIPVLHVQSWFRWSWIQFSCFKDCSFPIHESWEWEVRKRRSTPPLLLDTEMHSQTTWQLLQRRQKTWIQVESKTERGSRLRRKHDVYVQLLQSVASTFC